MIKNILVASSALILFTGCWGNSGPEEWTAYIYPDKSNNKRSMVYGKYPSLEQCQEASKAKLKELNLETRGDYQCGKNCEYHEGMKTQICEKMTK